LNERDCENPVLPKHIGLRPLALRHLLELELLAFTAKLCRVLILLGDLNADHRLVNQAIMTAVRPTPGQAVAAVYGFETLSSTEWVFHSRGTSFRPNRFVGIERTLKLKLDALRAYQAEMRDFPHSRSYETVEMLAKLRGSAVGLAAAEAFTVLREVEA